MLTRRRRWLLRALAAVTLLPVMSPATTSADHGTPDTGRLKQVYTRYYHHNPWICESSFDDQTYTLPDCDWPRTLSETGYKSTPPERVGGAPHQGTVVTRCEIDATDPASSANCGHSPRDTGNPLTSWRFGGQYHPIHQDEIGVAGRTAYVCSASVSSLSIYTSSMGPLYRADGHPVQAGAGEYCGTAAHQLCISEVTVTEGARAILTITASGGTGTGTVRFATSDGTAAAGSDYTAVVPSVHTFDASTTSQPVIVATIDDTDVESAETFTVTLSNADSGASISCATATVTILDNEPPPTTTTTVPSTPTTTTTVPSTPTTTTTVPSTTTTTPPMAGCDAPHTRLSSLYGLERAGYIAETKAMYCEGSRAHLHNYPQFHGPWVASWLPPDGTVCFEAALLHAARTGTYDEATRVKFC